MDAFADPRLAQFSARLRERFGLVLGGPELSRLAEPKGPLERGQVDQAVLGDEAALQELLELVTVRETHFFRHGGQLEAARSHARHRWTDGPQRPLSVLSAACASGEEAYSLAAALDAVSKERATPPGVTVLGFDASYTAIATACAGRYNRWSLRGPVPDWAAHAVLAGPDGVTVSDRLRALTRFEPGNLLEPEKTAAVKELAPFDVIFCRNALMYLGTQEIQRAIEKLVALLAPDGLLVLSPVDPVPRGFAAYTPDPAVLVRSVTRGETPLAPVASTYTSAPTPLPRPSVAPRPKEPPHADDPAPLLKSVKSLADTGALDRARAAAALLIKRYPRLAAAHWLSGMVELDASDVTGALRFFERAVALEPGFAMAHFGLATALSRGGRRAEARAALVRLKHLLAPLPAETQLEGPEPINCGWLKTIVEAQLRD